MKNGLSNQLSESQELFRRYLQASQNCQLLGTWFNVAFLTSHAPLLTTVLHSRVPRVHWCYSLFKPHLLLLRQEWWTATECRRDAGSTASISGCWWLELHPPSSFLPQLHESTWARCWCSCRVIGNVVYCVAQR